MLPAIVLGLAAAASTSTTNASWVRRLELSGCTTGEVTWGAEAYAVNPDAQIAVLIRTQEVHLLQPPPNQHQGPTEVVAFDLRDNREVAKIPIQATIAPELAISRDGTKVVIAKKVDSGNWGPWHVCLWLPYSDPAHMREYNNLLVETNMERQWRVTFEVETSAAPAISPDGKRAVIMGWEITTTFEGVGTSRRALGILELETGKISTIPLPVTFDATKGVFNYWYLSWSDDESIYAVLHGDYGEPAIVTSPKGGRIMTWPRPDNLMLYRFSPDTKATSLVGRVPASTVGFASDGQLIVTDAGTQRGGPLAAFGRVAISEIGQKQMDKAAASGDYVNGLEMEPLALAGWVFDYLFVGQQHTYAEVREAKGSCRVLMERRPASVEAR